MPPLPPPQDIVYILTHIRTDAKNGPHSTELFAASARLCSKKIRVIRVHPRLNLPDSFRVIGVFRGFLLFDYDCATLRKIVLKNPNRSPAPPQRLTNPSLTTQCERFAQKSISLNSFLQTIYENRPNKRLSEVSASPFLAIPSPIRNNGPPSRIILGPTPLPL